HHAQSYGLKVDGVSYDLAAVVRRSRGIAGQLSKGVAHLLRKNKVTVIMGTARLAGKDTVSVETKDGKETVRSPHIILATGARARQLPGLESDGRFVWSYRDALVADVVPKTLLVVGSGAIGIEFASFFKSLGSDVTVVEVMGRVLPVEDAEISAFARKAFEKRGMKIVTGAQVKALKRGKDSVEATIEAGGRNTATTFERVIMATGIVGNVEDLGLEEEGIKVDRTHVVIDPWCRTAAEGVYAIGDLAGPPWLAHKASHEGVLCVEKIAGLHTAHPLDVTKIPGCTYCTPQVASVGLTEEAAKAGGHKIKVGRFPFIGNGKAIALGEPEGLVKTVFDEATGELLGAHMIGAEVTELIQGYGIARQLEGTELDLMATVFPHPTLSEMMHEAALDAFGRAIHF
ncbi:MAG: dihydrolipoyl dehydrogenase, partial [Geminicoccaceae bacterium]|nr:dihydrolipoyl dehydrogenase [Geminicoccaceae bacterium]